MQIIKHYGRPMEFIDRSGRRIERKDKIFLRSHRMWYETADMDNHFIYESTELGSGVLCTCGSIAAAFSYDAYKKYMSNRGMMLFCVHLITHGIHADGSS